VSYSIGVCLGQPFDSAGIAVIEGDRPGPFDLRHVERWRKVPYPEIVEGLRELVEDFWPKPSIALDETGAGRPVVELFRKAGLPCHVTSVIVTAGGTAGYREGAEHVPKRNLVSLVAVFLQTGRFRIARGISNARTLERALRSFRSRVNLDPDATATWRENGNDDLVLSVALALWTAEVISRPSIVSFTPSWMR
jgi:hypothetical protein